MELYDSSIAPSPRRVRIFLAEKGISVPRIEVDLRSGEQLSSSYREINPQCCVPYLLLDDGSGIGEVDAICRYFEAIQPEPALLGREPLEQARITMWNRRIENEGMAGAAEALRNRARMFHQRALTGPVSYAQIPALVERGIRRTREFMHVLDERLQASAFVAGDAFTMADITAFVFIDFAAVIGESIAAQHSAIAQWQARIEARPSARA